MAALVDTNVLVCRYDSRFPEKQRIATSILREGVRDGSLHLSHQAIVEFVAATTRPIAGGGTILSPEDARREAEEMLWQFDILFPTPGVARQALRGAVAYGLSWFDAHMWAYAEHYGLAEIFSEDFPHDRLYGSVRAVNPFV